ncbi:tyrosine-type recombinase/integrase [Croceimicrobium sp.]|uniref:tyrosine-type recombinase/integrase n=1 Tax=Croceimicrobium sp. TaxID=2828340 RepID=UPI003BAB7A62
MMKVTLRKRPRNNGKISLYLDYYPPIISPKTGKSTRFEYLEMYLYNPPRDEVERKHNREVESMARAIAAERQLDRIAGRYGLSRSSEYDDFLVFYEQQMRKKSKETSNQGGWAASYKTFSKFVNDRCTFGDLKPQLINDYKDYLLTKATRIHSPMMRISESSAYSYYNKLRACVREATALGYVKQNPFDLVKGISQPEVYREFLTKEELIRLANSETRSDAMKRSCLFSALTGMRMGDIMSLTWEKIQYSDATGYFVRFNMNKTKAEETLPLSEEAILLLGEPTFPEDKIFGDYNFKLHYSELQRWLQKSGITKKITFHNFRHTFATLQLAEGTDIYTVSKLLGHKNIHTTQIYGKVMDKTKTEAMNRIHLGLKTDKNDQ